MPKALITKEVMQLWTNRRAGNAGNRLRDFKTQSGVGPTKALSRLGNGSYKLEFNSASKFAKIWHWSTAVVDVDPEYGITKDWSLIGNFDDFGAFAAHYGCLPPTRLANFLESSMTGPCQLVNFAGKPKVLRSMCDEFFCCLGEGET